MKKIEAPTLEEAYTRAAAEFECSVAELEVSVAQYPSRGVLGFFAKPAIIVAKCLHVPQQTEADQSQKFMRDEAPTLPPIGDATPRAQRAQNVDIQAPKPISDQPGEDRSSDRIEIGRTDRLVEAFNEVSLDTTAICQEIAKRLNVLFANTCYKIEPIAVDMYDEKTVRVFFDGVDAALLIGRDGYRYKALSYILFNWINPRYGYLLRLEIAEFLQNQEEMITRYLEPVIEGIYHSGRGQTRVLDGVLVQIALKELRTVFPNKYVAIKTHPDGGKFVVVNDFVRKY